MSLTDEEVDLNAITWYSPDELALYAYVGEDELGEIEVKEGLVPAGMVPLVATALVAMERHRHQLEAEELLVQLQLQANKSGKVIRLVRFEAVEDIRVIVPQS